VGGGGGVLFGVRLLGGNSRLTGCRMWVTRLAHATNTNQSPALSSVCGLMGFLLQPTKKNHAREEDAVGLGPLVGADEIIANRSIGTSVRGGEVGISRGRRRVLTKKQCAGKGL